MEDKVTKEELKAYIRWCEKVLNKKPNLPHVQTLKINLEKMINASEKI